MSVTAIGIDLGTTNCVVSYVTEEGEVETIPNLDGDLITPTAIYLDQKGDGKIRTIVGKRAKQLASTEPEKVLTSFKTFMGTPTVMKNLMGYNISSLTASYLMLKYLKDTAERYLDTNIFEAVISVPAYFTEPQVEATKIAAKKAGLTVKRILIEPSAAAFYYGIDTRVKEKVVAVYDLGGGTFDISIISLLDDTSTVMGAPKGDNKLGGDDIDREIANYVLKQNKRTKVPKDVKDKIIRICEKSKIELCNKIAINKGDSVIIDATELGFKEVELTKTVFESMIDPLVNRTLDCFQRALEDAGVTAEDLDEVVLVGGSSRIPYIRERLTKFLNVPRFSTAYFEAYSVDPDLEVGLGCGVFLKFLAENKGQNIVDVVSKSIGIEDEYGDFQVLIRKGRFIPSKCSKVFTNAEDGQTAVTIKLYEGDSKLAANNEYLGKVVLPIESGKKHTKQVLVYATITADGVLEVKLRTTKGNGTLKITRQFDENEDTSWVNKEDNNVEKFE